MKEANMEVLMGNYGKLGIEKEEIEEHRKSVKTQIETNLSTENNYVSVIVRPTKFCNLDCKYCYTSNDNETCMEDETLKNVIEKVTLFNGKNMLSYFNWQGGEPLLASLDFYKEIIRKDSELRADGYRIMNGIQTNGVLLNSLFIDFLEQNNFQIGLSVDGPPDLHNMLRSFKGNNNGSFNNVFKAINLLKEKGIEPCVVSTLSKHSMSRIKDIYEFFSKNGIYVNFNPIECGNVKTDCEDLMISPEEYGTALIELFDMWFYDQGQYIEIDPLTTIIGNLITGVPYGCTYTGCQKHKICVDPSGDVYPCNLLDFNGFCIGNINENSMEEIYYHPLKAKINTRISNIADCQSCQFKNICNSGCSASAYMMSGDLLAKDYFCQANKMIFRHILDALHEELYRVEKMSSRKNKSIKLLDYDVDLENLRPALNREIVKRNKLSELDGDQAYTCDRKHQYWVAMARLL